MASPAIRGSPGTAIFGTASTLAPTPPGHAANTILLAIAASSANASVTPTHAISGGSGTWVLIGSGVITSGVTRSRTSVYWRRAASGSETAPTITFTPTGSTACHHMAQVIAYDGCITSGDPFEGVNTNSAAGASALALTLTTTVAETLGVAALHHADNVATGVTDDSSYTTRTDTDNATGIDGFTHVSDMAHATSGSGKGATFTFTSGGTGVGISGVIFALKPPATQTITPTGIDSTMVLGTQGLVAYAGPSGVDSSAALGTPGLIAYAVPSGIDSSAAVGSPTAFVQGPVQQIDPTGIDSSVALGSPGLVAYAAPSGIDSSAALGSPQATAYTGPSGIDSSAATGSPVTVPYLGVIGVNSGSAVGSPGLVATATPSGIAPSSAVGSPVSVATAAPTGIDSSAATGAPGLIARATPSGIDSSAALGSPTAAIEGGDQDVTPTGIDSSATVGSPGLVAYATPTGIDSTAALGSPTTVSIAFTLPPASTGGATTAKYAAFTGTQVGYVSSKTTGYADKAQTTAPTSSTSTSAEVTNG